MLVMDFRQYDPSAFLSIYTQIPLDYMVDDPDGN